MKKEHERALEDVKAKIAEAIDPKRMSVNEAREFLEELKCDLSMQLDCLPTDEG